MSPAIKQTLIRKVVKKRLKKHECYVKNAEDTSAQLNKEEMLPEKLLQKVRLKYKSTEIAKAAI